MKCKVKTPRIGLEGMFLQHVISPSHSLKLELHSEKAVRSGHLASSDRLEKTWNHWTWLTKAELDTHRLIFVRPPCLIAVAIRNITRTRGRTKSSGGGAHRGGYCVDARVSDYEGREMGVKEREDFLGAADVRR